MTKIQEMLKELRLELEPFTDDLMIKLSNGSIFNTMMDLEKHLDDMLKGE